MDKKNKFLNVVFFTYMVILFWIIAMKMGFSLSEIAGERQLNLIPFYYDDDSLINIVLSEFKNNILVFVPFGGMLYMKGVRDFKKAAFSALGVSLFFEVFQYIFAVGICDVTDLINNTIGGILGFLIAAAILKNDKSGKRFKALIVLAAVLVTCFIALAGFLTIYNW